MEFKRIFTSVPEAIGSGGLWKAFFYSFGSWIIAWGISFLALPEATTYLGKYGIVIPMLNTILVFLKQYFDALLSKR